MGDLRTIGGIMPAHMLPWWLGLLGITVGVVALIAAVKLARRPRE